MTYSKRLRVGTVLGSDGGLDRIARIDTRGPLPTAELVRVPLPGDPAMSLEIRKLPLASLAAALDEGEITIVDFDSAEAAGPGPGSAGGDHGSHGWAVPPARAPWAPTAKPTIETLLRDMLIFSGSELATQRAPEIDPHARTDRG